MKNKNLLIIFFCFALVILPLKQAWAFIFDWLGEKVVKGIAGIIRFFTKFIHELLFFINIDLLAKIVNYVATLNPFKDDVQYRDEGGQTKTVMSPVKVIWNILKNFAYILLVFSALFAGYEWLMGKDANAKRLIFNIIIVALLISFTFVLVREAFLVVYGFEKGITGGNSNQIGTIIAASLWQKNPFTEIDSFANSLASQQRDNEEIFISLASAIGYIFIIVFDMLILIILFITAVLFIIRYLMIIFLGGTSSIALATLAFPEFKGALGQVFANLKFWNTWLEYFIRWLLVIPIFVILVILGNALKENTLGQIQAQSVKSDLIEFMMLLLMLEGWYIISIIIANKISKGAANLGKAAATAAMLTVGGLTTKGLMSAVGPRIGNILSKTGGEVEERFAGRGFLGSWVSQKIGKPVKKAGEDMLKRRYELEAKAIKSRISTIDEQLRREKDPEKQAKLTDQLVQLTKRYENVPYVLKQINEEIGKMSRMSFEKIATNKDAISLLAGADKPQELREKVISQVDKLSKGTLRNILGDRELLEVWSKLSLDVSNAFIDKLGKELSDADVIEQLTKEEIRNLIPGLPGNFQKAINRLSKGFVEAATKKDLEAVSNALASLSEDVWRQPENIDKALRGYELNDQEIKESLKNALTRSTKPEIIINTLRSAPKGDPIRRTLSLLTDTEINEIERILTPQLKNKLETIILEESA
ncbi:MAG: hypothetical protein KatS3mg096_060 [Candidatus Parcubacteria bacterium]|nr:MAG: hypothetical protein KatS3mg096_060 [Candidatus Parcubacteria bacterium]